MDADKLKELRRLASLYFDEGLEVDDIEKLSEFLVSDDEAKKAYFDLLTTHSDLTLLRSFVAPAEQSKTNSSSRFPSALPPDPESSAGFSQWLRYGFIGFLASLFTMATYFAVFAPGSSGDSELANDMRDTNGVARIIQKVDCDWEGDRWSVVSSTTLVPGQTVSLNRGLMELEFASKARVTLQAPVSFTVKSAMRGVLAHGKLTAEIPESAHGFTVETPSGESIDLGTKFGVFVDQDGTTETHVFEGEVVVKHGGKDDEDLHLSDNMAVRLGQNLARPFSIAAVPERFTSLDSQQTEIEVFPAVDRDLSLWFSADRLIQKDEQGQVISWGDQSTKSNLNSENAWQVDEAKRPVWVADSIGGLPAVRFSERTVMVTEPVELGASQTIAVVFQTNEALMKRWGIGEHGRQIVNFNGPPQLVMRINNQRQLTSHNYKGFHADNEGRRDYVNVGKTVYLTKIDARPVVAVSVYDPSIRSSRLYINGVMVDDANAPEQKPTNSPRYIGAHMFLPGTHFFGDIAELMVYDTGLTNQEVASLSASLLDKYQLRKFESRPDQN